MITNIKTNKLATWLPKRRFIKLLNLRKACPLSFNERLVFSMLAYVSRKKKATGLSQREIARRLELDKDTVPKIITSLIAHGLAERDDGLVHAKEPTGDRINWFVFLNKPGVARWQDQYAYLLVALPAVVEARSIRKLSPHQIGLYCLLINKEKEGKAKLSTASMAGLLGIDVRTVRSALKTLEECGFVELHPRGKSVLVTRPSNEQLEWFQVKTDQPKKTPLYSTEDDMPWEEMTEQEIHDWVFETAVSEYSQLLRQIRYYGRYSTPEIEAIRKKIEQVWYATGNLALITGLYQQAEKEHKQTQQQGQFLGRNSYSLLSYKLDQFVKGKNTGFLEAG